MYTEIIYLNLLYKYYNILNNKYLILKYFYCNLFLCTNII